MSTTSAPNVAFEVRPGKILIVIQHGANAPTDQEWTSFLAVFGPADQRLERMRVLVLTEGGRPSRAQQSQLTGVLKGRAVRTAVISSSVAVRFLISTLALINPGIRGYARSDLPEAFAYLEIRGDERALVEAIVQRLSLAIAGGNAQASKK